jgi:ketosteroid isomerase-like protein
MTRDELLRVTYEWDRAMVTNDVEAIGRYMAEDWIIVGTNGSVTDRTSFLTLVGSGVLSHDVMESHNPDVRVYGDSAVVICLGTSGGHYQGRRFDATERVSCVYVKHAGEWRCVLTHLSRLED